jgi:hypothetical protein
LTFHFVPFIYPPLAVGPQKSAVECSIFAQLNDHARLSWLGVQFSCHPELPPLLPIDKNARRDMVDVVHLLDQSKQICSNPAIS